jgi:acyl-CoA reductase-like NAD-dependent aldehyde dehydrogenase
MATLRSLNPVTGRLLGEVAVTAPEDVAAVAEAVAQVQPIWAALTLRDRARYLQRAAQVLIDEGAQIRDLIAAEQGRPRVEAYATEVLPAIDALRFLATAGQHHLAAARTGLAVPLRLPRRAVRHYEPLGVIGVICRAGAPWSDPLGRVASALMAGNGVVLGAAALTPLCAERLRHCLERAGVPEGLIRVIHGPGTDAALAALVPCPHGPGPAAPPGAGGVASMLVLADAELDRAVAGAVWGAFANCGQGEGRIGQVYVARGIAEPFTERVVAAARSLRLGDPLAWETEIGPIRDPEHHALAAAALEEALAAGAQRHCGGPVPAPAGLRSDTFFAPAVLTTASAGAEMPAAVAAPGPVVTVIAVADELEAVRLANRPATAPAASVWTRDRARGERVAAVLAADTVWINDHRLDTSDARVHAAAGLRRCAHAKLVVWGRGRVRDPRWFPYDETLGEALAHAATILHGRSAIKGRAIREGTGPLARTALRAARASRPA